MSVLDAVGSYYDAWMAGKGDFSAVPLAPDFAFTGPVASFDTAEGFREMASQAGPMVTRFTVRRQFADGDTVCSIIDWEMALPIAAMTSAEILQVRDGTARRRAGALGRRRRAVRPQPAAQATSTAGPEAPMTSQRPQVVAGGP